MKKTLILYALFVNAFAYAQNPSEWRLSKETFKGAGWTGLWEYNYDNNLLKEVRFYQDKKLFSVYKNFKYDAPGNITSYQEIFYDSKTLSEKHYFTYSDNKLIKKEIYRLKNEEERFVMSLTYQWTDKKVTLTRQEKNFAGLMESSIFYLLDDKKNITYIEGNDPNNINNTTLSKFTGYDKMPNPKIFTKFYHDDIDVISSNNPLQSFIGGTTDIYTMKYNSFGLTTSITATTNYENSKAINVSTYMYIKRF
ncbi:MAG: hypothetical protein ABIR78_03950 [Ferruginibacter sp.]